MSSTIITLIGMPGCGKSTVGKVLAKQLGLDLLDTDNLIEAQENLTLQQIVDARGNTAFRAIEEQVLTAMPLSPSVISTGGSVVYSEKIMARLSANSLVIYLRARLETIEYRVSLAPQRGIASEGQQTLSDLYAERVPLYEHYGEVVIDSDDETPESIADTLTKPAAGRKNLLLVVAYHAPHVGASQPTRAPRQAQTRHWHVRAEPASTSRHGGDASHPSQSTGGH